jgi:hypothetical protein
MKIIFTLLLTLTSVVSVQAQNKNDVKINMRVSNLKWYFIRRRKVEDASKLHPRSKKSQRTNGNQQQSRKPEPGLYTLLLCQLQVRKDRAFISPPGTSGLCGVLKPILIKFWSLIIGPINYVCKN